MKIAAILIFVFAVLAHAGPDTQVFEALIEADLSEFDSTHATGSNTIARSATATHSMRGGGLVTCSGSAGDADVYGSMVASSVHFHLRYYWKEGAVNMAARTGVLLINDGAQRHFAAQINADETYRVRGTDKNGTDDDWSTEAALADVTWYQLYLYMHLIDGGEITLYRDDVEIYTFACDLAGVEPDNFRIGGTGLDNGDTGTFSFDDIVIDTMPCAPPNCSPIPVKADFGQMTTATLGGGL